MKIEAVNNIYPLTIVKDRYNGTYSKGKYLAFNLDPCDIDSEIGGSDTEEMNYWDIEKSSFLVGKGDTIEKASIDLLVKLNEYRQGLK